MSPALRAASVLALFTALTALLASPLSLAPGTRVLPLSADTRLFLWTISWDVHALASDPLHVFDANIFFPERHTLAYSEHLIGSALLGAPFLAATGNPVLAMNAVVLLSCVLSGAGAYFLSRRLGIGTAGALAAGVVFAFAPPRFARLAQVHLATVEWIPFCLGFLHAYAEERRRRDLLAAAALFTLEATTSGHGGLFLLLAVLVVLGVLAWQRALPPPGRLLRDLGVAGAAVLAINLVFLLPYFRVQREVGLHRTIGAVYDWSPNAVSFLAAETHAQRWLLGLWPSLARATEAAKAYLFPGWLTLVLAALAGRAWAGGRKGLQAYSLLAILSLWASLGPGFGLYTLLYHVVPGFDLIRVPSRLTILTLLALAVLGGAGLDRALTRPIPHRSIHALVAALSLWAFLGPGFGLFDLHPSLPLAGVGWIRVSLLLVIGVVTGLGLGRLLDRGHPHAQAAFAALVLVGLVGEFAAVPLKAPDYAVEIPAVDRWLATQPGRFAIAELPVADPGDATRSARLNSLYMLHSTAHWQRMVNGYSGFVPPRHETLFRVLTLFPDTASLSALQELGVQYVVVHRAPYSEEEWARVERGLGALPDRLKLEHEEPDGRVYSLTGSRTP